jgi:2-polyprenyl-6-methoxyphenol hydroxylase-like FAD-dependent oxidoreductase
MTVLIAGAGIGGLALALSCAEIDVPVRVFESVRELKPLGVGVNLQPHAVRELAEMGLVERIAREAVATREVAYYSRKGNLIWSEPRGREAGYRWPQFSVHRGRLQMILLEALRERLGPESIRTGHHLADVEQDGDGVRARLNDRASGEMIAQERGDVLVAADGIHSRARGLFYPDEGPPLWNGAVLWRGVSRARPFLTGATMAMAGHEGQKFVVYPIAPPDAAGLQTINWIAERRFDPATEWRREDWNRPGRLDEFLPWFADWRFDWLDIPALIEAAEHVFEYPMVDRDPLPALRHSRVTLLGDAAHPMYPIGSNGASQAILDARVLTRAFLDHGVGPEALAAYEGERRPATSRIVLANRANGPDQVLQVVEERCGGDFRDVLDVLTREELEETASAYKRLAGFERDALNACAPIVPPGSVFTAAGSSVAPAARASRLS